jgi:ubiquitin-like-conjugating enzyme ATG3
LRVRILEKELNETIKNYYSLDSLVPVLKESKFRETGFLTPDEFVMAGNFLVHHCPTWQWASGDKLKIKDYLPKDKQFLITKNVPCSKRCKHLMDVKDNIEKVVEEESGDGGWVKNILH